MGARSVEGPGSRRGRGPHPTLPPSAARPYTLIHTHTRTRTHTRTHARTHLPLPDVWVETFHARVAVAWRLPRQQVAAVPHLEAQVGRRGARRRLGRGRAAAAAAGARLRDPCPLVLLLCPALLVALLAAPGRSAHVGRAGRQSQLLQCPLAGGGSLQPGPLLATPLRRQHASLQHVCRRGPDGHCQLLHQGAACTAVHAGGGASDSQAGG